MKKIEIQDSIARPSIARPLKAGLLMAFFAALPIAIGTTGHGRGLGLSLSYDIVKAHGGELKVNTKLSEFTEIVIQLPVQKQ